MRRMFSENQIKSIVNQGIQSGEIQNKPSTISIDVDVKNHLVTINFQHNLIPLYCTFVVDGYPQTFYYNLETGEFVEQLGDGSIDAMGIGLDDTTFNYITIHIDDRKDLSKFEFKHIIYGEYYGDGYEI